MYRPVVPRTGYSTAHFLSSQPRKPAETEPLPAGSHIKDKILNELEHYHAGFSQITHPRDKYWVVLNYLSEHDDLWSDQEIRDALDLLNGDMTELQDQLRQLTEFPKETGQILISMNQHDENFAANSVPQQFRAMIEFRDVNQTGWSDLAISTVADSSYGQIFTQKGAHRHRQQDAAFTEQEADKIEHIIETMNSLHPDFNNKNKIMRYDLLKRFNRENRSEWPDKLMKAVLSHKVETKPISVIDPFRIKLWNEKMAWAAKRRALAQTPEQLERDNSSPEYLALLNKYNSSQALSAIQARTLDKKNRATRANRSDRDKQLNQLDPVAVAAIQAEAMANSERFSQSKFSTDKYRALLQYQHQHQRPWLDRNMRGAAGINSVMEARAFRRQFQFATEHPQIITHIIQEMTEHNANFKTLSKTQQYQAMYEYRDQHMKEWSLLAICSVADITYEKSCRINKTLETEKARKNQIEAIREEIKAKYPEFDNQEKSQKYMSLLDYRQSHNTSWSESDLQLLSGISGSHQYRLNITFQWQHNLSPEMQLMQTILHEKQLSRPAECFSALQELKPQHPTWSQTMIRQVAYQISVDSVIKQEEQSGRPLFNSRLHAVSLDMARTAFYPEKGVLHEDQIVWIIDTRSKNRTLVRHGMEPYEGMDDVFFSRDPNNPLLPHPDYANPNNVTIGTVKPGHGFIASLLRLAEDEQEKEPAQQRLNLSPKEVRQAIKRLVEQDIPKELARTLHGRAHTSPLVYTRQLTKEDLPEYEEALIGQYGMFVNDQPRPPLAMLSIYNGVKVYTQEEQEQRRLEYGEEASKCYEVALDDYVLSPLGGTNSAAFANTSLNPNSEKLEFDEDRISALMIPFTVMMAFADGREREEELAVLLALDNLDGEVRVNYGEGYLERFQQSQRQQIRIKTEEDTEMSGM